MADDDFAFDPSMKKKKKTKKPEFDDGTESTAIDAAAKDDMDNVADGLDDLALGKKKKKPKKKAFNLDDPDGTGDAADNTPTGAADAAADAADGIVIDMVAANAADEGDLDFDFQNKKKKKKKGKVVFGEDEVLGDDGAGGAADDDGDDSESLAVPIVAVGTGTAVPWANSDRDYSYEELLNHVFNIIKEKNPDIIAGEKRRLIMRPPQVLRVGTKKSSFANFIDICKSLHRQPKHMQAFLLAELGTSGSVDANNQLIIKGRFQQKQIESVLRRYIKEYVACQTCRSPETILQKDTRLFFLQCETCGSRRSVASIKSGFQAVTGKRAAMRAKTA